MLVATLLRTLVGGLVSVLRKPAAAMAKKRWNKQQKKAGQSLLEMHFFALRADGRAKLRMIFESDEEIDPVILAMYQFFYDHAPVDDYARFN